MESCHKALPEGVFFSPPRLLNGSISNRSFQIMSFCYCQLIITCHCFPWLDLIFTEKSNSTSLLFWSKRIRVCEGRWNSDCHPRIFLKLSPPLLVWAISPPPLRTPFSNPPCCAASFISLFVLFMVVMHCLTLLLYHYYDLHAAGRGWVEWGPTKQLGGRGSNGERKKEGSYQPSSAI